VGDGVNFDLRTWSAQRLAEVEDALSTWVPADAPAGLGDAMRYAVLDGGKRLRPLLVIAACEAVAGHAGAALRAGCAVELIHAYSLVHDDMPCMDNDVLRRGKPTVHVQFGEATALLAGDALQALAFELLTPAGQGIADARRPACAGCSRRPRGTTGWLADRRWIWPRWATRSPRTNCAACTP
jgi:farnesyl diphosphate synthase